jgi:hypothetical protein
VRLFARRLVEHSCVAVADLSSQPSEAEVHSHLMAIRDAVRRADGPLVSLEGNQALVHWPSQIGN